MLLWGVRIGFDLPNLKKIYFRPWLLLLWDLRMSNSWQSISWWTFSTLPYLCNGGYIYSITCCRCWHVTYLSCVRWKQLYHSSKISDNMEDIVYCFSSNALFNLNLNIIAYGNVLKYVDNHYCLLNLLYETEYWSGNILMSTQPRCNTYYAV